MFRKDAFYFHALETNNMLARVYRGLITIFCLLTIFAEGRSVVSDDLYNLLEPGVVIDSLDTVYFDLREAVCSGPYIDIPLHIQSDDDVYAIDFAVKLNVNELTFLTVVNYSAYLYEAANFNAGDSTSRFTSFCLSPAENDSDLVSLRFVKSDGYINAMDFTNTTAQLNGDYCSFKVVDTDPAPYLSTGPSVSFQAGDSAQIVVTATAGSSFLWSTGESSDQIYVDSAGLYTVTVTAPGSGCAASLSVNVNVAVPLPVEFGLLSAERMGKYIGISWSTFSESMNDYFVVERSADGRSWMDINWKDGAGWSSSRINYAVMDSDFIKESVYYRIRQIDYNGDYSLSPIVVVPAFASSSESCLHVFPNPFRSFVTVSVPDGDIYERYDWLDNTGRIVDSGSIEGVEAGYGSFVVQFKKEGAYGLFYLELETRDKLVRVPCFRFQ